MTKDTSKAYENIPFLNSHDARPIRVLCELLEPATRLEKQAISNTIVFFGSARSQPYAEALEKHELLKKEHTLDQEPNEKRKSLLLKTEKDLKLSKNYEDAVLLSEKLSTWSLKNFPPSDRYYICSGGGPGMMEAANKGAKNVDAKSVALGISLPFEQGVNSFATPELSFEFHYFFIRKFYFLYHAKAVVVFPGGFGTMDELFEVLTLIQTKKIDKKIPIFLFGKAFWEPLINFEQFVDWGVISPEDLNLFQIVDEVEEAYHLIVSELEEGRNRNSFQSE